MRSPNPRTASLPTRLSTQLSSQLQRARPQPTSSIPSLPRSPRFSLKNSLSNTYLAPSDASGFVYTMVGPIRNERGRVEGFNPMGPPPPTSSQASTSQLSLPPQAGPSSSTALTPSSAPAPSASRTRESKKVIRAPRPTNSWIMYRRDTLERLLLENPEFKGLPQAELSKRIADMWKKESLEVRREYERRADVAKEQHQKEYPDYQFRPMKKADKERLREEKRAEKEREREAKQRQKELQQQMRRQDAPIAGPSTLQATPSQAGMPAQNIPSPFASAAPSASATSDGLQSLMVVRCGVHGPSPPVSECPSPEGSPYLPSIDLTDSSSSRSSSLSFRQDEDAPSPASSGSQSLEVPQPSGPPRPSSANALRLPSPIAQDASRPASTVQSPSPWAQLPSIVEPSADAGSAIPDIAQGEGALDWFDASTAQNVAGEMFDFSTFPAADLNFASTSDLSLGGDNTMAQASMYFLGSDNVFGVDFPMANFENPLGEISVAPATFDANTVETANGTGFGEILSDSGLLANINFDDPATQAVMQDFIQQFLGDNAAQQHKAQDDANGVDAANDLNLENFINPEGLSMSALPSPPDSLTSGSKAALSPYDMTVQPTNLGASGSGQSQMAQMYAQHAQGQAMSSTSTFGEMSQPTPPTSAGPIAPSPQATQIQHDAFSRPVPTHTSRSASSYVPPTGAALATRRRAAGSWKPPTS